MKIIYISILCGLKVIRGETKLEFHIDDSGKCVSGQSDVVFGEGDTVRADFYATRHINYAACTVHNKQIPTPAPFRQGQDGLYLHVENVTRDMSGLWTCRLKLAQTQTESVCKVGVEVTEYTTIPFIIESESKGCQSELSEGSVNIGSSEKFKIQITVTPPLSPGSCYLRTEDTINRDNVFAKLDQLQQHQNPNDFRKTFQSEVKEFISDMHGKTVVCEMKFIQDSKIITCELPIKSAPVAGTAEGRNLEDTKTGIIIGAVVGVIVVLIIVGQTIALLYFRKRAKLQERMDNLRNATKPFGRSDQARYSAPPRQRSPKREHADTDSHIYEMVGVNEMYNAGSNRGKTISDIKDRPRLPLPTEAYDKPAAMDETVPRQKPHLHASTLSLEDELAPPPRPAKKESPLSRTLPRPTVQKEPPSLPCSLQRPPKPVPKNGSVPKNIANDPALLELRNALKKRIVESQPQNCSTPEKKIPPIPIKKPQPDPPKKPTGVIPPVSPPVAIPPTTSRTSNLKAKLEAAFSRKPPEQNKNRPQTKELATPDKIPQTKQELAIPARVPQTKPPLPRVPETKPEATVVRPQKPVLPSLPLPRPVAASGLPYRPLPPIETSTEDLNQDDDDEWTYEPLDKFNIYNV